MKNNPLTMLAVRYLTYQLRKDKGFWMAYQANIAMIISDNIDKYYPYFSDQIKTGKDAPSKHEFCNICANDFIVLWTEPGRKGKP